MSQINLTLWAIILAYVAFIFIKGVSKARHIGTSDDFLVAGRDVKWFALASTIGATVIGGGASIGAIGSTYEMGILWALVTTGWYLQFIFSGMYVAPKFREAKLYTVAGYFGHRFGEGSRFVAFLLSLIFSVFLVAAQMAAFGTVLSVILPEGTDTQAVLTWAIIIGGLMVIIYSTAGGLLAVIHTDVYQFIFLLGGFLITLLICVPDLLSSWGQVSDTVPATFLQLEGGKGWIFLATTFFAFLLGETFAPGYATRFCVGLNKRHTRIGIAGVGAFLALVFPAVLFFIALYARMHFPDIEPQQALPMVVKQLTNVVVAGLFIGALLMAVMSSADSALNSATAIFVKDLFEHHLGWSDVADKRILLLARGCSALLGVAAVVVAAMWTDIIGILLFSYMLWAPAIFLPVCIGVFSRESSHYLNRRVFLVMVVSIVATLVYYYGFPVAAETFNATLFGVSVSCVAWFGLGALAALPIPSLRLVLKVDQAE